MAMVANNARDSAGADREGRSARLDKWTVISGAILLVAATLTAFLAPEEGRPRKDRRPASMLHCLRTFADALNTRADAKKI
ncbi:hypothetical protein JQ609_23955 [Bradyrhizobium sp. AUGA SZCCT0169]|uniref:hypothetical protein n=1 Tax=Bradyrhizobium sp. AUGA SZCCT0169 TaxID=2807663 RepID=UPI001BAD1D71|nr:hypothetical protein [Bradyrhizobium sp. AUGA SZCCT0169]MBR1249968.1 hypothetical protein [Bradyrhizobium sp. AUGA SZCCT0169]